MPIDPRNFEVLDDEDGPVSAPMKSWSERLKIASDM